MTRLYTAVGRFEKRSEGTGKTYPVILVNREEFKADIQEMIIWTALNWRILSLPQIVEKYAEKAEEAGYAADRTCEQCIARLLQRGLIVSGAGDAGVDALYDLLSSLYVVPTASSFFIKVVSFLKLTLLDGLPLRVTRRVFHREPMTEDEDRIIQLAGQTLLSTAEIIKCVEKGAYDLSTSDKVLEVLYNDDTTTCDNLPSLAKCFDCWQPVTAAVANLYLRKQIIFERI